MGKEKKTSNGTKKISRLNNQITRIKMKISRWERYIEEINKNDNSQDLELKVNHYFL